jgi:hypothetical protein
MVGKRKQKKRVAAYNKPSILVDGVRFKKLLSSELFDESQIMRTTKGLQGGSNCRFASKKLVLTSLFCKRIYFLCMFFYRIGIPSDFPTDPTDGLRPDPTEVAELFGNLILVRLQFMIKL